MGLSPGPASTVLRFLRGGCDGCLCGRLCEPCRDAGESGYSEGTVARVTPERVVLTDGRVFRRPPGGAPRPGQAVTIDPRPGLVWHGQGHVPRSAPSDETPFVPPPRLALAALGSWGQGLVAEVGPFVPAQVHGWATTPYDSLYFGDNSSGAEADANALYQALGSPGEVMLLGSVVSGEEVLELYCAARTYTGGNGPEDWRGLTPLPRLAAWAWNPGRGTVRLVGVGDLPRLPYAETLAGWSGSNPLFVFSFAGEIHVFLFQRFGGEIGGWTGTLWARASAGGVEVGANSHAATPSFRVARYGLGAGGAFLALGHHGENAELRPVGPTGLGPPERQTGLSLGHLQERLSDARVEWVANSTFAAEGFYTRGVWNEDTWRFQSGFLPYSGAPPEGGYRHIGYGGGLEDAPTLTRSPSTVTVQREVRVTEKALEKGPVDIRLPADTTDLRRGDRLRFGERSFIVGGVSVEAVEFLTAAPLTLAAGSVLTVEPRDTPGTVPSVGSLRALSTRNVLRRFAPISTDATTTRTPGRWQGRLPPAVSPDWSSPRLKRAALTGRAGDDLTLIFPPLPEGAEWGRVDLLLTYRCKENVTLTFYDRPPFAPHPFVLSATGRHWGQRRPDLGVLLARTGNVLKFTTDGSLELSSAVLDLTGTQGDQP
ncbi:hypothetical protein SAMN04488058_101284 [Deinococcus reticulitermitis]|uniref:Uncharacterized protein n=1 Tax=Deinococcus reticulitermitis TaxID=856736 RepID=A0A1H6SI16_9DEIO|nr:hypothetical protein [Deinococcus reticulitermitis]SEI66546.1 hypothetical protein SAMN04488058_101284 [Deinococcus reticulitermitis]